MKRTLAVMAAFICSLLLFGAAFYNYASRLLDQDTIYPGITINAIDVSGLSKDQAKRLLQEQFFFDKVIFKSPVKEWVYDLNELGFGYEIEQAADQAYATGRNESFLENFFTVFNLQKNQALDIPLTKRENFSAFDPILEQIASELAIEPKNARIQLSGGYQVTPSQKGQKVDREALQQQLSQRLQGKTGALLEVPLQAIEPAISTASLKRINGVIGQFSSQFNNKVAGRSENITLAAKRLNNKLLMPGDRLSFNGQVGDISIKNGYKNAPVIVKGVLQEGIGGGVCQVSSTLYNSLLYAGLDVKVRNNHSIPSTYVDIGRDAVVVSGQQDLKFQNGYDFPVYLKMYVSGNQVTAQIHGDVSKVPNRQIDSKVVQVIPMGKTYIYDPKLPAGQRVERERGRDGIRSETTLTVNGKTRVISKDYYPMKKSIIAIGTGR